MRGIRSTILAFILTQNVVRVACSRDFCVTSIIVDSDLNCQNVADVCNIR
jgi:hypothetical protein